MTPRFITPRLTAPQLTVLRALDALPDGMWAEPKAVGINRRVLENIMSHDFPAVRRLVYEIYGGQGFAYRITPAGRALVARLKVEGAI